MKKGKKLSTIDIRQFVRLIANRPWHHFFKYITTPIKFWIICRNRILSLTWYFRFASLNWVALLEILNLCISLKLLDRWNFELGKTISWIFMFHWFPHLDQVKIDKVSLWNINELISSGEQKTKPIQNSVRTLRGLGLSPDLIVCRCKTPIEEPTKAKISTFCNVLPSQVISVHDVGSIYRVPIMLHDQKVTKYIRERERVKIGSLDLFLLRKTSLFSPLIKITITKICSIKSCFEKMAPISHKVWTKRKRSENCISRKICCFGRCICFSCQSFETFCTLSKPKIGFELYR